MAEDRAAKQVTIDGKTYYVDENNNYYVVNNGRYEQITTPGNEIVQALKYSEIYSYDMPEAGKLFPDVVVKFRREKPPRALPTTVDVPERAERLQMPLLGESVAEEVKRLTLELITDPSDVLNANLNFRSINNVPEYEIGRTDDEESFGIYFEEDVEDDSRRVVPLEVEEDMEELFKTIKRWTRTRNTNFAAYADNFILKYDYVTGRPSITLNVPVNDGIIDQVGIRPRGRRGGERAKDEN